MNPHVIHYMSNDMHNKLMAYRGTLGGSAQRMSSEQEQMQMLAEEQADREYSECKMRERANESVYNAAREQARKNHHQRFTQLRTPNTRPR